MNIAVVAFIINTLGIRAGTLLSDGDDGIDARVRVQKTAYFLKRLGYDIGFEFDLYYHGPYSSELANTIELLAHLGDDELARLAVLCLEAGECRSIRSTVERLNQYPTDVLEVASMIRSLLDAPDYRDDLNGAIDHVRFLKPWVSDNDIKDALNLLRSLGLLG
ncbi:hypothetical protein [Caldivirga sp. MU80]|uniref:hypothetical protein n=1 Tax=Caldivirga sp. MU80 TaxID=1650354 RepID=UPI00082E3D35|nr:hypothetical protein [Caldivirga sp. MU80]